MKKLILLAATASFALAGAISVENPWVKMTPPTAKNSAIFMTIKNASDKDVRLVDAQSNYAESTEIHNHIHEDGMMKMVRIKDALVPASGALELKPKSYHVMLMGIKKPVDEATKVNVKLTFSNGEVIELKDIPSKAVKMDHHHGEHGHGDHHGHGEHGHGEHGHHDHGHGEHGHEGHSH